MIRPRRSIFRVRSSGVHTSLTVASGPAHGTTSVSGDVVTYTPTGGYFGADSFTYTATGPGGTSSAATVTLDDCHACRADRVGGFGKREL
jgi:hypothetical protein